MGSTQPTNDGDRDARTPQSEGAPPGKIGVYDRPTGLKRLGVEQIIGLVLWILLSILFLVRYVL